MKILHLMLACFYIDDYSYQENYLPKYHKEQGHEVEIVASLFTFDKNGKGTYLEKGSTYINEYGIRVTRLDYAKTPMSIRFRHYIGLKKEIDRVSPELIFCHGVQFSDITIVRDYCKKNPNTRLYIDNHSDFSNSATNWISKKIQHEIIWRHYAQMINPYVTKFYGVLPARVDFLVKEYKLPKEKVELLVMGADDHRVFESSQLNRKNEIRKKLNLSKNDFVVMTGGKIDQFKTQTLLLMEAVKKIEDSRIKLIVFGSVTLELKSFVNSMVDGRKIQYIGWIQANDSYDYFAIADLVVFPGRHSVFWEQVVAQGIPLVVKYWQGTTHIDCGGNVKFLYEDSCEEIMNVIKEVMQNDVYQEMKKNAQLVSSKFLYSDIALKSIRKN